MHRTWKGLGGAWTRSTGSDSHPFKEETESAEKSMYMKEALKKNKSRNHNFIGNEGNNKRNDVTSPSLHSDLG